jgi:hypothetical protein
MRGGDGHQDDVSGRRPSNLNPVTTMKTKILALAVLSMVAWLLSASNASAFLPCFHRNYSVIVCRPYNAFTPMCYGNVVCDGCCPSPYCGAGSCQPPIQRCLPPMCGDGGCMPGANSFAAAGPMMMPMPVPLPFAQPAPQPMPNGPNFTPPPPTPTPNPGPELNQTTMRWNPQAMYGVQPAGYYPSYYPAYPVNYYPVNNYPTAPSMPAPYYWYGQ